MKNLFDCSTKELSQDAFICWLVNNYDNKDNESLMKEAYRFINYISGKNYKIGDIKHLVTQQQVNDMDIILDIWEEENGKDYNDTSTSDYVIVIEDKSDSSAHKDQLLKYYKKVEKWTNKKGKNRLVFYKSNYLSWSDMREINLCITENIEAPDDTSKWRFQYKTVWNPSDIVEINNESEWKIFDIDFIFNHFNYKINTSEIYDSYIDFIYNKHKKLNNILNPTKLIVNKNNNYNKYEWVSYFRRVVSKEIEKEFEDIELWADITYYDYVYLGIKEKYFNKDGAPNIEIRSKDCLDNKIYVRVVTYGLDDSDYYKNDASKIREAITRELSREGKYKLFKVDKYKENNKQLGHSSSKNLLNGDFIYTIKEHLREYMRLMENVYNEVYKK